MVISGEDTRKMGNIDQDVIVIACLSFMILLIVFMVFTIVIWRKLNTVRNKYNAMIAHTGVDNLEGVITELQNKVSQLQQNSADHNQVIQQIKSKISEMNGNVTMHRYNAFNESGSDLSFSIAIVNDQLDGLVFTSIHGREETYCYGKPLVKGESTYPLSPEEIQVINSARSKSQNHV
jgi:cytochrome c oxidase assembly protein Cox11